MITSAVCSLHQWNVISGFTCLSLWEIFYNTRDCYNIFVVVNCENNKICLKNSKAIPLYQICNNLFCFYHIETLGHCSGWARTPKTYRWGDRDLIQKTPTSSASKHRFRWDETLVANTPGGMIPTMTPGGLTPSMTPGQMTPSKFAFLTLLNYKATIFGYCF